MQKQKVVLRTIDVGVCVDVEAVGVLVVLVGSMVAKIKTIG